MKLTLGGYTQAYNLKSQHYPWRESIQSLLELCDEVVVVDGGSTDGTYEELLAIQNPKLKVHQIVRDWNCEEAGLYDGMQKAEARKLCSSNWLIQLDSDEVIHESDYESIRNIVQSFDHISQIDIISFPFVEFWGGSDKVRCDFVPMKPRLSRNVEHITHGIPLHSRAYTPEGRLYSLGDDGCSYIDKTNFNAIPNYVTFSSDLYSALCHVQSEITNGNKQLLKNNLASFEEIFNSIVDTYPTIYHYSWFNLEKKINAYRNFWSKHWCKLYNFPTFDVAEYNMFFDKPWSDVSEGDIKDLAQKMKDTMAGWIFHKRIDFSRPTYPIKVSKPHPYIMQDWISQNE